MPNDAPYDRPDLYDLLAPPVPEIEHFYVEIAIAQGARILDLACGSGRFTIPLAEAGADVVGADLSEEMLDRARQAAEARGVAVELMRLDMRDFDLGGRVFDTILLAMNSILHLHTLEDFKGFFGAVARHLAPGGRLVFDAFVPNVALLARDPDKRYLVDKVTHAEHGQVTVEEIVRYDPLTQVSHVEWYWSRERETDFWRSDLALRQIFPQEMPLLVASGGLRLVERFGDFDGSALSADSPRQICVCAAA